MWRDNLWQIVFHNLFSAKFLLGRAKYLLCHNLLWAHSCWTKPNMFPSWFFLSYLAQPILGLIIYGPSPDNTSLNFDPIILQIVCRIEAFQLTARLIGPFIHKQINNKYSTYTYANSQIVNPHLELFFIFHRISTNVLFIRDYYIR